MTPFLTVKNLTKRFGGLIAVKGVEFSVNPNEILGIIGPNGAGKTTLFNLLSGFYQADKGEIIFKGESVNGLRPYEICKKGIVRTFQVVRPFLELTVLENVLSGSFNRLNKFATAYEEACRVVEFAGLAEKRNFLGRHLTIADRKRLELAKAIATSPTVILLDEVMAGLNPVETTSVMELIRRLRETGVTIMVIEHVMRAIMALADRLIVLNHGVKIAEGSPRDIAKDGNVIKAYLGTEYQIA